jgi:phage terminase Nu1 subunit (DNA packaging protein)
MARPKKIIGEIVDTQQLAVILALTERRIRQLCDEGIMPKVVDSAGNRVEGKWDLVKCVQAYIKFKVDAASATDAEASMSEAKLRKMRAQAEQEELKVDLMKGRVIRCVDAEQTWGDFVGSCRSRLLSLPTKLARTLIGQKDIGTVGAAIEEAITEALDELKDYSIDDIQSRNPQLLLSEEDDAEPIVGDNADDSLENDL